MSGTVPMGVATSSRDDVAAYVREVRAQLADLPAEESDDLTSGMEADLGELAEESGGRLRDRLGTPQQYAAELRAAAGLPVRGALAGKRRRPVAEAFGHVRGSFEALAQDRPWLRALTSYVVSLRPAWWLLRGCLVGWLLSRAAGNGPGFLPDSPVGQLVTVLAIALSLMVGAGRWSERRLTAPALVLGNGLALDGAPVANVYVYDSGGRRLGGVWLFDQDGRRLDLAKPTRSDGSQIVRTDVYGQSWANVYPQSPRLRARRATAGSRAGCRRRRSHR